jgi:hypothetical protein
MSDTLAVEVQIAEQELTSQELLARRADWDAEHLYLSGV